MITLWLASCALRCPAPMMQQARKGEVVPVGAAPGWGPRRRRFSGGVVQTGKPPMTSAIAIHEATRDTEPKVVNYVTSHTAAGAEAPSAESDPQACGGAKRPLIIT